MLRDPPHPPTHPPRVQLKAVLMAIYFGADHFVWAYQIGLITNKTTGERWQKVSLWSWALGSACTVAAEGYGIAAAKAVVRKEGESDEEFSKRQEEVQKAVNARVLTLVHGLVQVGGANGEAATGVGWGEGRGRGQVSGAGATPVCTRTVR